MDQEINLLKKSDIELNAEELAIVSRINTEVSKKLNLSQGNFELSDQEFYWLKKNPTTLWPEYIEYRQRFKLSKLNRIVNQTPVYLLVEPTSVCNLACPMCFQADKTFTQKEFRGMMDIELFKKLIDEYASIGVSAVTLASRGEPTLHPKISEMLKFMKGKFLDIKLNTNGTKLTEKICRDIIENGVNEIVFSIDAADKETYEKLRFGAKLEVVLNNVITFKRIRDEYPDNKTLVRISGVKILSEQDWEEFASFWGPYFDQIGWVPAENRWDTYNNAKSELTTPCSYLWERIYIWHDGKANPCDVDYKSLLSPGKFPDSSLMELWNSQKLNEIRGKHLKFLRSEITPCDRCGVC